MSRVAHYVERWLDLSAGFVAAHVELSRHQGSVIARDGWLNLDAFPFQPRHSLHHVRDRVPDRFKDRALRALLDPLLLAGRIDLVHVHFGYAANDLVDVRGPRRPLVLSLHGNDVTALVHSQPQHYGRVVSSVDAVIVPSTFLADRSVEAGFAADRVRVIPSGVDTAFFTPTPLPGGPPVVGYIGRLVEKKGLDVLLAAWPAIRAEVADARLCVLGEGDLAHLLDGGDPTITWLRPDPTRRHEQVRDVIRSASVVVTPSRTAASGDSESLLLVNLEAGASRRPVVSTRHGGIPEYVDDGRTGLLVPEGDPGALAAAVVQVLRDPALAGRLADAALNHVSQWDIRRSVNRIDDLYDELLGRRSSR